MTSTSHRPRAWPTLAHHPTERTDDLDGVMQDGDDRASPGAPSGTRLAPVSRMRAHRPAFALATVTLLFACGSSSTTTAGSPDAASDTPGHCGAIEECNCKDGTNAVAGCEGPPTCEEACANHQGLEPEGQCADGETFCQGECVNLKVGSGGGYNCGKCGVICPEYSGCSDGNCKVSLPVSGHFACRADSDCHRGEECVLNANTNCPPFCAPACSVSDGGASDAGCSCGAAIDVGTSAHLSVCLPAGGGC